MKIGSLVRDKETGQYLVTVSEVSHPPAGGPRVRVVARGRAPGFLVWTSSVEVVPAKDNPFRRTYAQWVLFVIAEVLSVLVLIGAVHRLQEVHLAWWEVSGYAAGAMACFNTVIYRIFGLHQ
jgi:hypothetical protein